MTDARAFLSGEWKKLTKDCDESLVDKLFDLLAVRYTENHRYYHNLSHLSAMLVSLNQMAINQNDDNLRWAIFFHDAIYNPKRSDNELKSAELASLFLHQLNYPETTIILVEKMIMQTVHQFNTAENTDDFTKLLIDLDLQILGATNNEYLMYADAIRKEYSFVPTYIFKRKRKAFLKKMLSKTRIYRTEYFYEHFEEVARKNIISEIQSY